MGASVLGRTLKEGERRFVGRFLRDLVMSELRVGSAPFVNSTLTTHLRQLRIDEFSAILIERVLHRGRQIVAMREHQEI